MVDTIDTFIDKLRADGVEAGQAEAEKIRTEAEQQARTLIQEAEAKAKETIDHATAESKKIRAKADQELNMVARDSVMKLRDDLNRALQGILATAVTEHLNDAGFLQTLLHDVVMQYVQADIKGSGFATINVSEEMRHRLTHWAIETLHKNLTDAGMRVDLHGSLHQAGFEYRIGEGTVEVTTESVIAFLSDIVGQELREILSGIASGTGKGNPA